ncbi:hypothetical protein BKA82DRAFT_29003 [Pisolithus tinctorius]|uniref:Uncharacterized protein n=1 Tax=Pisolithus tinctorius Marx 270 TaxID=870435 RepID=A0A0C3NJ54_PISTI|nr:hypothetical protein BKA82DRAFT_29003 [Pisolithus tinctorius]KIO01020.1 hypothetical protein M404DRAFT_29003 [Pisolithus tinctorius Marx 270]
MSLPSDDSDHPNKKLEGLVTTVSLRKSKEVKHLQSQSLCILELAWASHAALAAQPKYCHLWICEIDTMHMITVDKYEEAIANLRNADHQIGEVQHVLTGDGMMLSEAKVVLPPIGDDLDDDGDHSSFGGGDSPLASYPPSLDV